MWAEAARCVATGDDDRLQYLLRALALITGRQVASTHATLGELGVDSSHLVELMLVCDHLYDAEIGFEALDIDVETTVAGLHGQILAWRRSAYLRHETPLSTGDDGGPEPRQRFEGRD